jgi:hypothetical protein
MLTTIEINLQEGLILDGSHIIGGYSHHNKCVILLIGRHAPIVDLPKHLKPYNVYTRVSDSMSLQYWCSTGWVNANDIVTNYEKSKIY